MLQFLTTTGFHIYSLEFVKFIEYEIFGKEGKQVILNEKGYWG